MHKTIKVIAVGGGCHRDVSYILYLGTDLRYYVVSSSSEVKFCLVVTNRPEGHVAATRAINTWRDGREA